MRIDVSELIQAISLLVNYLKEVKIVLNGHIISLWAIVIALGTLESINFILNMKNNKNDD